jgi:hypothetical protein
MALTRTIPFVAGGARVALQPVTDDRACFGLAGFDHGIFEIDRDAVGIAGQRLGEEFGPRTRNEQFASHGGQCLRAGPADKAPGAS